MPRIEMHVEDKLGARDQRIEFAAEYSVTDDDAQAELCQPIQHGFAAMVACTVEQDVDVRCRAVWYSGQPWKPSDRHQRRVDAERRPGRLVARAVVPNAP